LLFQAMKGSSVRGVAPAGGRLTFGVADGYFTQPLDPDVRAALDRAVRALRAAGHTINAVEIRHAEWTADAYLHIVLAEAAWEHVQRLETHADLYSPGVRMRLEMGRYVLAEDYVRGMRIREALAREVDKALEGRDALLLPTMAVPAPLIGAATVEVDGVTQPVRAAMLKLTQLFNMTGHPALPLPVAAGRAG